MDHYCMYLRKSRADFEAEARGEGETLARHEQTLRDLATKMQVSITAIYKEIVSGESIAVRPVMQRLLAEVAQGLWRGVLVMEVERLARGATIDQGVIAQTFKYANTLIITPIKTYDPNNEFDEEYFEFGLFMSRREYKTINRRMQRGRLASVQEGKYVNNRPPYGYTRKKLENAKGFTLEPVPDEAEAVRWMYLLYTQGERQADGTYKRLGVSMICRRLNAMGIPPRHSDVWVSATVRDILINPVYCGNIRWNWRPAHKKMTEGIIHIERPRSKPEQCVIVQGLHEPIVDDKTWRLAQDYIKQNPAHPGPSQYALKNPMSGIVYCGKCGRSMVRRPYKHGGPDTLMCPVTACDNVSVRLQVVETHIITALNEWLKNYSINWEAGKQENCLGVQTEILKKALQKTMDDLNTWVKQIAHIHDLLEQGVYTVETFHERKKVLSEQIETAQQHRISLTAELERENSIANTKRWCAPKVEQVLAVYALTDDPRHKNELLKSVLEKVLYTKTTGGRRNEQAGFSLAIIPKIPQ